MAHQAIVSLSCNPLGKIYTNVKCFIYKCWTFLRAHLIDSLQTDCLITTQNYTKIVHTGNKSLLPTLCLHLSSFNTKASLFTLWQISQKIKYLFIDEILLSVSKWEGWKYNISVIEVLEVIGIVTIGSIVWPTDSWPTSEANAVSVDFLCSEHVCVNGGEL